jgi:hypothetical protein
MWLDNDKSNKADSLLAAVPRSWSKNKEARASRARFLDADGAALLPHLFALDHGAPGDVTAPHDILGGLEFVNSLSPKIIATYRMLSHVKGIESVTVKMILRTISWAAGPIGDGEKAVLRRIFKKLGADTFDGANTGALTFILKSVCLDVCGWDGILSTVANLRRLMQTMPTSSGHQAVIARGQFHEYAFYDLKHEATRAGKTVMSQARKLRFIKFMTKEQAESYKVSFLKYLGVLYCTFCSPRYVLLSQALIAATHQKHLLSQPMRNICFHTHSMLWSLCVPCCGVCVCTFRWYMCVLVYVPCFCMCMCL